MFTEQQLEILDQIDPYIDGEDGESRKGRSQVYPLIHITASDTYWCIRAEELLPVPAELVGSWIAMELCDRGYYDKWRYVREFRWQRAEQKEVTVTKWLPITKTQGTT